MQAQGKVLTTIPLAPFQAWKGEEIKKNSEGHPFGEFRAGSQASDKGASTLSRPRAPSAW